jgi:hypothetical protein
MGARTFGKVPKAYNHKPHAEASQALGGFEADMAKTIGKRGSRFLKRVRNGGSRLSRAVLYITSVRGQG